MARFSERLASATIPYAEWEGPDEGGAGELRVTFSDGRSYVHGGVTWGEFAAFVASSSPGRFWHAVFKGR